MDNTPTQPVDNASAAPTDNVVVPPAAPTTTDGTRGSVQEAAGSATATNEALPLTRRAVDGDVPHPQAANGK
jgi:hypothetical protein